MAHGLLTALCVGATLASGVGRRPAPGGPVRVVDHCLVDSRGPFLGLGVSYFTALRHYRDDRALLERNLSFLSEKGFVYYRMLSMVGWYPAWDGLEIAPVGYTRRDGKHVEAWGDYWKSLAGLVDLAFDRYRMRTQITIFADAQLMPRKEDRIEHMRRLLADVVAGRERKIILLEVANEAWQNGFPGDEGVRDLREFTRYLAERTAVPVATTSNHEGSFEAIYKDGDADIATWHFSRDRSVDGGWGPVTDCRSYAARPGCPPVSSNEPIGPGSSVASESDPGRLVLAAAFAFASRVPMYVFHSAAGVFGRVRFEDTPAINAFRNLARILPPDLPNWQAGEAHDSDSPLSAERCVRLVWCRKGDRLVGVVIGIPPEGCTVRALKDGLFSVTDPISGRVLARHRLRTGQSVSLPQGPGGLILAGRVTRSR